jgi:Na+:H+ antiporter, NhaA family
MNDTTDARTSGPSRLNRPVDRSRDHVRGGSAPAGVVTVLIYGDYLCPYCRRLRLVMARLRRTLGERLAYVFRHSPNEKAHPGADFASRAAEAAGNQSKFWEMHDKLYETEAHLSAERVRQLAKELGLDMNKFERDVEGDDARVRVAQDLEESRRNGVTVTPTIFIDGIRYDGAWDFHSMLETLQKPVAERLERSARVFASLPASGGMILIAAAALALICANSPLAPYYADFISAPFGIGPVGSPLSMTVGDWFSEGLLAIFFLIVGLDIRREMTTGTLSDARAAALPIIGAVGGVLVPAAIYLSLNRGPSASGWSVPTNTDIAFTLGILALLGTRVPTGLRVFVAALAVVDDVLSVLTLAIFYPHNFHLAWLLVSAGAVLALFALNRGRVFASWPYLAVGMVLWTSLHTMGIHAALTGIFLAALLPTRPAPAAGPLLAQAATALSALEYAENEIRASNQPESSIEQEPAWDWASRNLSAASDRLMSPADRFERALSPWTAYLILPLFAFSATGIALDIDFSARGSVNVFAGVIAGLVIGKPLGISMASLLAVKLRVARMPDDVAIGQFIGAACLCGIGDTMALLLADQAFPGGAFSNVAKLSVLIGSFLAAALGSAVIAIVSPRRVHS